MLVALCYSTNMDAKNDKDKVKGKGTENNNGQYNNNSGFTQTNGASTNNNGASGNKGNKKGDSVPLDGGLSLLLAGAAFFGARKLRHKS